MLKELSFGARRGMLTRPLILRQNKHICIFPQYFRFAPLFSLPVAITSWD